MYASSLFDNNWSMARIPIKPWQRPRGPRLGKTDKVRARPRPGSCAAEQSLLPPRVQWSRKVIETFALPEHKGKGVITVEGRMVERLHLVMAERVVAIWEAIAS